MQSAELDGIPKSNFEMHDFVVKLAASESVYTGLEVYAESTLMWPSASCGPPRAGADPAALLLQGYEGGCKLRLRSHVTSFDGMQE